MTSIHDSSSFLPNIGRFPDNTLSPESQSDGRPSLESKPSSISDALPALHEASLPSGRARTDGRLTSNSRTPSRFSLLALEYREQMGFTIISDRAPRRCMIQWRDAARALSVMLRPSDGQVLITPQQRLDARRSLLSIIHDATLVLASAAQTGRLLPFGNEPVSKPQSSSIASTFNRMSSIASRIATTIGLTRREGSEADIVAADELLQLAIPALAKSPENFVAAIDEICTTIQDFEVSHDSGIVASLLFWRWSKYHALPSAKCLGGPIPSLAAYHIGMVAARAYAVSPRVLPSIEKLLKAVGLSDPGLSSEFLKAGQQAWEQIHLSVAEREDLKRTDDGATLTTD